MEPAIFGTLFERGLDPGKRSQLGAHHTRREDILLIVEPVVIEPLQRRWVEVFAEATALADADRLTLFVRLHPDAWLGGCVGEATRQRSWAK